MVPAPHHNTIPKIKTDLFLLPVPKPDPRNKIIIKTKVNEDVSEETARTLGRGASFC